MNKTADIAAGICALCVSIIGVMACQLPGLSGWMFCYVVLLMMTSISGILILRKKAARS